MSRRQSYRGRPRRNSNFSNKKKSRGGFFDPSHLVKKSRNTVQQEVEPYQAEHTFADFGFEPTLQKNIESKGYQTPTPIQDKAIPLILQQKDVIGLASTGTGKTAAFLLPIINLILKNQETRVLVVAPTRELALQIQNELQSFSNNLRMYSTLCIGGTSLFKQEKQLQRKPQFVIGTPGRIIDLAKRNKLQLHEFNTVVLDEVDRMLDMGFIPDVKYITSKLPKQKQALFFSATMPEKLHSLVPQFMHNPTVVEVEKQKASDSVRQEILNVKNLSKVTVLLEMLSKDEFEKVLVFGRTKHGLNKLARTLADKGLSIALIHGNKSQNQRQRALKQFRSDKVKVLLATDVASRGLDIDNVTHVINYDLPQTEEDYIHRIGRTGRADNTGVAVTFVS